MAFSRIEYHFHSFNIFSLYHRIFLYFLSQSTMVNLDFILCANSNDPGFKLFGKWYYLLADVYVGFGSYLLRVILVTIAFYLKKVYKMAMGEPEEHEHAKDQRKDDKKIKSGAGKTKAE